MKLNLDPDPIFKTLKRNKTFLGYLNFRIVNFLKYSKKVRGMMYYGSAKT